MENLQDQIQELSKKRRAKVLMIKALKADMV